MYCINSDFLFITYCITITIFCFYLYILSRYFVFNHSRISSKVCNGDKNILKRLFLKTLILKFSSFKWNLKQHIINNFLEQEKPKNILMGTYNVLICPERKSPGSYSNMHVLIISVLYISVNNIILSSILS